MAARNTVEVVIAGKVYKLCGSESREYLQRVASYLNSKTEEVSALESYRHQNADLRQIELEMNLADDYFKEKEKAEKLEKELEKRDKELYTTRHDLIEAQLKAESLQKSLDEERLKAENLQKGLDEEQLKAENLQKSLDEERSLREESERQAAAQQARPQQRKGTQSQSR